MFKVHPKEKAYFKVMSLVSIGLYALIAWCLITGTYSLNIYLYIGFILIFKFFGSLFLLGYLKGNAIKIDESQLPEIYKITKEYSQILGFKKTPEIYLLQGNGLLNAFATKIAKKHFVVLYADVLELAYQEGIDAVSFIIGHELGHLKRDHVGLMKNLAILPARCIPFLNSAYSRACEYTCDNIGYSLCSQGATKGLLLLGAGKQLYKKISLDQLSVQKASGFAVAFVEAFQSHPVLMKRIASIKKLDKDNIINKDHVFISPQVKVSSQEIETHTR